MDNNNNNGRMVSRHSTYSGVPASSRGVPASSRSRRELPQSQPTGLCCNRCHKPLATTVFVCKCNCVFCEECTYEHFNQSSSCAACGVTLGADDFLEMCIADPSTASQEASKISFQDMLTKSKQGSPVLSYADMGNRLLKSYDDNRRKTTFLFKQLVKEAQTHGQRTMQMTRVNQNLTQENTQLKQAASSQRIQTDQTIADLQNRLSAMTVALQEKDKQVQEKDKQISQFRQHYAAEGMAHLPSSSNSMNSYGSNSNGGRRTRSRSNGGGDGSDDMMMMGPPASFHHDQQQQLQQAPPPIQGFVQQKEARERAKEQELSQMTRSRGPFLSSMTNSNALASNHPMNSHISHGSSSNNMMMMSATPIVLPRESSGGSGGSSVVGSGRVRDIRAVSTTNQSFGSRSSHQQQQQTRPPSTAFAFNHYGSSNASSSSYRPSNNSNNNNNNNNSRRNGYGGGRR